MAAQWIDGKALAAAHKERIRAQAAALRARGITPRLAVILVGENPASLTYVAGKERDCAECGILSDRIALPADTPESALLAQIDALNRNEAVHGVLVQLPLPPQIDPQRIIEAIAPEKDVDGFTPINMGRLALGQPCFVPCTPAGCLAMLEHIGCALEGKHAVVLGRSNIVGKPMAMLLSARDATVTLCHSKTQDTASVCAGADLLVAAVGRPHFVMEDMVKPGAVVLDVGINRGADGKLCGDVAPAVAEKAAYLSPVPGGVGLMTRAMLLHNTLAAACGLAGVALDEL